MVSEEKVGKGTEWRVQVEIGRSKESSRLRSHMGIWGKNILSSEKGGKGPGQEDASTLREEQTGQCRWIKIWAEKDTRQSGWRDGQAPDHAGPCSEPEGATKSDLLWNYSLWQWSLMNYLMPRFPIFNHSNSKRGTVKHGGLQCFWPLQRSWAWSPIMNCYIQNSKAVTAGEHSICLLDFTNEGLWRNV